MLNRNKKRLPFEMIAAALLITAIQVSSAVAQGSKIKVGRTVGGSGFHIPSYVAMDRGFFKSEGLDAAFIATTGGVLVRAAIAKEIEFVPIPAGGSEAILQGAPLIFLVGQSLISQWTLTTTPDIKRVEDLKGKTIGLGRPGSADYSEIVVTLGKNFKMEPGKDYKVIAFGGEPDRVAALINRSIQAGVLSFPHAAPGGKGRHEGFAEDWRLYSQARWQFSSRIGTILKTSAMWSNVLSALWRKPTNSSSRTRKETIQVIQKYFEIDEPPLTKEFINRWPTPIRLNFPPS